MSNEFNTKIEAWYESKITFIITLLSPVIIVMLYVSNIQTHIALIQQSIDNINVNHETHIQDIFQQLKEQRAADTVQQAQIIELQKQILIILNKGH